MAKGDMSPGGGAQVQQQPKIDQYSVMHRLMDLQNAGGAMAPSQGKQMPMPMNPQMGQMMNSGQQPMPIQRSLPIGGGGMNQMPMSNTGGAMQPSVAPSNPQEMIRRAMIGKGTFGQ